MTFFECLLTLQGLPFLYKITTLTIDTKKRQLVEISDPFPI